MNALSRCAAVSALACLPLTSQNVTTVGTGCASTVGIPTIAANQGAWLNEITVFTFDNLPPALAGQVVFWIGGNNLSWGGLPLPYDLSAMGAPGCTLYVDADFLINVPYSGTSASFSAFVPPWPFLINCQATCQFAVCDPNLNTRLDAAFSPGLSFTIGRR